MRAKIKGFVGNVIESEDSETLRYGWVYIILIIICAVSTAINWLTGYVILTWTGLIFALLCALDYVLCRLSVQAARTSAMLFAAEAITLYCGLLFTGFPEGFGVLWICLLPTCGMFFFKRLNATLLSAVMLLIMVIAFWTPFGSSLLRYDYDIAFRIRFPFLFCAFFIIAFLLETIRSHTYDQLESTKSKYEHLYSHDELTGLLNRYGLNALVDKAFEDPSVKSTVLVLLDLDYFKQVNDTYGHLKGDEILKETARILSNNFKVPVARWGGEEFAILCTDGSIAEKEIYRICRLFENHVFDPSDTMLHMTISIGAAFSDGDVDAIELFRRADRCLYESKAHGRNQARMCYLGKKSQK